MALIKDILRTMDYGPAPEGSEHVAGWLDKHKAGFGCFINGRFARPEALFDVFNPATGERIAGVSQGSAADVDQAVAAARKAAPKWATLSGHERAGFLYALARHVQKRERFLSVLETIDNGKPIRESRDIDVPLVARHFYHHAGWAALIESEFPGTRPAGVCGQIIPWNFPLLMLAWKIAPALAAGNTVVLKPAEYTPLTALAFAEICVEGGLPAGVVNIVTGDGATGAALVEHRASTRSPSPARPRSAARSARRPPGRARSSRSNSAASRRSSCSRTPISTARSKASSTRSGSTRDRSAAPGRGCWRPRALPRRCTRSCGRRMAKLRVGDPLDKSTDVGAIVAPAQLERIERLMREGEREGLDVVAGGPFAAESRLLLPADPRRRGRAGVDPGARGDLRSGAGRDDLPHAGRGGRARQQHPLRPRRLRLDRERQSRARSRRPNQGGRRLDQFDQHVRRRLGLRRLSRKRLRP